MTPPFQSDTEAAPLPESLRPLFWEYDFDDLSWQEDRHLIFRRVLAEGPWETVRWLRRRAGDEALREWLRENRGRPLSRRQLRFWQLILDLPEKEVNGWLEARAGEPWERRTTG